MLKDVKVGNIAESGVKTPKIKQIKSTYLDIIQHVFRWIFNVLILLDTYFDIIQHVFVGSLIF
jgi:hypothetical protein